jgi:hypothetical protein
MLRAFHDVSVRDDEAGRIDDEAGADNALAADGDVRVAARIFFNSPITSYGYLNDARRNFFDESFDGGV